MKSPSRKRSVPAILLSAVVLALSPGAANAHGKSTPVNDDLMGEIVIKAVNAAHQTIKVEESKRHSKHVYIIDDMTVVTVHGAPGKFSDLKTGMNVLSLTERDSQTLDALDVDNADKTAKTGK